MSMVRVADCLCYSASNVCSGASTVSEAAGGVDQQQVAIESRQHVGDYLIARHSHHVVAGLPLLKKVRAS
ncbi:MAG: hypothetical protein QM576_04025 [Rhodopseudomonas sp.]|uniref:hypothetical protein n=1 Tax=Rhodopseudomonas sp. TaxID=1078 RepID=UPI0039E382B9